MNAKFINTILLMAVSVLAMTGVLFAAEIVIDSFKAKKQGDDVKIEWNTRTEANILHFEVQRSGSANTFKTIATIKAKGSPSSYTYRDTDSFRKIVYNNELQASNIVTYRIRIVYNADADGYSDELIVMEESASIKRTWGMIKEMFK